MRLKIKKLLLPNYEDLKVLRELNKDEIVEIVKKYNLKTKHGIYTRYTPDNKLIPGGHLLYNNKVVTIHKCDDCGGGNNKDVQQWNKGNNYNVLWGQRKFFY